MGKRDVAKEQLSILDYCCACIEAAWYVTIRLEGHAHHKRGKQTCIAVFMLPDDQRLTCKGHGG